MDKIKTAVEELLFYASNNLDLYYENTVYVRNQLIDLLALDAPADAPAEKSRPLQQVLDDIVGYAVEKKIAKKEDALLFETRVMGLVSPSPYQVITTFEDLAMSNTELATKYLYGLSVNSNYIRKTDIDKNLQWKAENPRGDIMITINLSKPEKDPKDIAKAKAAPQSGYPKCALCLENVGFAGSATKAPRQTLRTIPIELNGEPWNFQFSPYVYYDNHCIAFSNEHRPMVVDINALNRMCDFIELFPHYFIGSNAALPIVGGSILSHDHYQGGSKVLPEMKAGIRRHYAHPAFQTVKLGIVDWYNSVLRIEGSSRDAVLKAANHFLDEWFGYSDKKAGIIARDKEQHNAITPIVRFNDKNEYVIDMILRNNRTDKEHPFGIFHPAEDLHNIKKEGIGIIEVMGLFILPGRLATEAVDIRDYLTGKTPLNFKEIADPKHPMSKHLGMIMQLANDHGTSLSDDEAEKCVIDYINTACAKILDTTAVFKNDEKGQEAFNAFLLDAGCSALS